MSYQKGQGEENGEFFFGSEAFVPKNNADLGYENISSDADDTTISVETDEEHIGADGKFKSSKKISKKGLISNIFEWLDVAVASVVVVVVLFTFVFRMVAIDGDSMNNTLFNGERVIISNMFYEPKRGDIVVISRNTENSASPQSQPVIKRVIATEGDTVNIDFENGIVYVNDVPQEEKYVKEPTYNKGDVKFPLVVKEDCVFVLGDNRNNSKDSRFSDLIGDSNDGQVNVKYILGRAILRIFPLNKFGGID